MKTMTMKPFKSHLI